MSLTIYTHPDCERHEMPGHPEQPARLAVVMKRIMESGIFDAAEIRQASPVDETSLQRVHPARYTQHVSESEPVEGLVRMDPDTFMSPGSLRASLLAAGACEQATRLVLAGESQQAFCAVRPPGHHAEIAASMGFCLFNNIAVAAETALQDPRVKRLAIVDFDVHHCNGTVDIFKDRPEVLVCSSFQDNYYPFRYLDFTNEHIINTPLAAGTRSDAFRRKIESSWFDAIARHRPDMLLISAGFDAHRDDPLASLELLEADFDWITRLLKALAVEYCGGRIVATLEGGYDLAALPSSVEAHLGALLG